MFYEETNPDRALRFGDVVRGFVLAASRVDDPLLGSTEGCRYQIDVNGPCLAAVLTPCCSIGDGTLALSPLIGVIPGFLDNPYLTQDLTRVNFPMTPEQSVPPRVWSGMTEDVKRQRFDLERPLGYAFMEFFVYASHDLLAPYTVHRRSGNLSTNTYMIDFRRIHRIECGKVANPSQVPLEAKLLQLSIEARKGLRDKLAHYFARVPKEDMV